MKNAIRWTQRRADTAPREAEGWQEWDGTAWPLGVADGAGLVPFVPVTRRELKWPRGARGRRMRDAENAARLRRAGVAVRTGPHERARLWPWTPQDEWNQHGEPGKAGEQLELRAQPPRDADRQPLLFDVPELGPELPGDSVPGRPHWRRLDGPGKCAGHWRHASGWRVQHCGHPTANYPYTAFGPDGRRFHTHNGLGFRRVGPAMAAAELLARGHGTGAAFALARVHINLDPGPHALAQRAR